MCVCVCACVCVCVCVCVYIWFVNEDFVGYIILKRARVHLFAHS